LDLDSVMLIRRTIFVLLFCGVMLGGFCSCRTMKYTPPARPVPGMFPTILPGDELKNFTPVEVTPEELAEHLQELGIWKPLLTAGMPERDLLPICRSLRNRGYGELDARRSKSCPVRWVIFLGYPADHLTIVHQEGVSFPEEHRWPIHK
jgi:hypothetical protein